jgi:hemerythrin
MEDEPPTPPAANGLDFICWDEDQMTTGVASIDEQHRELIQHLNELHRAHLAGAQPDDIKKILKFLGRFVATHFQHEEGIMEERQCPQRKENLMAHARFLSAYQELVSNFSMEDDPDQIAKEIKNMAARWLASHICRVDAGLRHCPAIGPKEANQSKPPPPQPK